MNFKTKHILYLLIVFSIIFSSIAVVSASDMTIKKAVFSTDGGLEDKTYASIYVGSKYSGDDVIIQIWYSRDGSTLNNGNMVPVTVDNGGYVKVASADAYAYFPDRAEINLYDPNSNLLDSKVAILSPSSGKQTFNSDDFGEYGSSSSSSSSYSTSSTSSSYDYGSSDDSGASYIGNSNSGKFHESGCGDVNKMKDSNKVYFSSRDEAINNGYVPCGHCHP